MLHDDHRLARDDPREGHPATGQGVHLLPGDRRQVDAPVAGQPWLGRWGEPRHH
jgi:hypothetical protein